MTLNAQSQTEAVLVYDLGGDAWTLSDASSREQWPATVPGSVHLDLLNAGAIPDPFFRENETLLSWIGERSWLYRRELDITEEVVARRHQVLRFSGLDTLATVTLNGEVVLVANNMHRVWEVEVSGRLELGRNTLEVSFASPIEEILRRQSERRLPGWYDMMCVEGVGWLRKQLSNFGWDWGPALVTAGIWRDAELVAFDDVRLTGVLITQEHADSVRLTVTAEVDGDVPVGTQTSVMVTDAHGAVVASATADGTSAVVSIDAPQRWWPRGLGEQPLYDVLVELRSEDGTLLDATTRRVGLRTFTLLRESDSSGESFAFACNGVRFFAKGANWIPADAVVGRASVETLRQLVADAADAHMNMLRVWGGGLYEEDAFYDACDEFGICVWQDVAFACATFPGDEAPYLENVLAEVTDNARRLRHHASLALWCGNNELEMGLVGDGRASWHMSWDDYKPLMDELLPRVLAEHDPERDYWPASPHTPGENRKDADDPTRGDAHLWKVWHGGQHPTWYRTSSHRFVSEFGFQSFPHPLTVEGFSEPGDRDLASPVMDLHQKASAAGASGSAELARQLVQFFRTPRSWDDTVWQTQLLQASAVVTGIEHWRRNMPETMGTLYWQLNDCWPGPSWSSIDSAGRWKALHYAVRRAYAPVMLSLLEDTETGTVAVHVTNDRLKQVGAEVLWSVTTCDGETLSTGSLSADVAPQSDGNLGSIDCSAALASAGPRNVLVWAQLVGDAQQSPLATFAPAKHLALGDPGLRVEVRGDEVTLTAERPALWVWLDDAEGGLRPSDNFFHMPAGKRVLTAPGATNDVRLRSLVDTFS